MVFYTFIFPLKVWLEFQSITASANDTSPICGLLQNQMTDKSVMAGRPGIKGDMEGLHYHQEPSTRKAWVANGIKQAERQGKTDRLYVEGNGGGCEVWSWKPPKGRGTSTSEDVQRPVRPTAAGMRPATLLGFCRVKPR